MKNQSLFKLILFSIVLTTYIKSAKLDFPNPATINLDYIVSEYSIGEQQYEFPHFVARGNLTFNEKEKLTQDVNFIPELHLDYTLTALKSSTSKLEPWGIDCMDEDTDDCSPGKDQIESETPYQDTDYTYTSDSTVMCFLDKFDIGQGTAKYKIRTVSLFKTPELTPWKSKSSGVLGLGYNSDLINYIYEQYNVVSEEKYITEKDLVFGIAIRLNYLKDEDRWIGK